MKQIPIIPLILLWFFVGAEAGLLYASAVTKISFLNQMGVITCLIFVLAVVTLFIAVIKQKSNEPS